MGTVREPYGMVERSMQAHDFIAHPHVEKEGVVQRFDHSIHSVKKQRNLQLSIRGEELLLSYWLYLFVLPTSQGHGLRFHVCHTLP